MTDHDPMDEMLAELRTDVPAMSHRAFTAGRARLQAVVAPAPVAAGPVPDTTVAPPRPRRSWRSPPRLAASAAAVVALVAGVLFVQQVGDNAPSAAAAQLNSAADRVDVTDEPIGPGQYRYIVAHAWNLSTFATPGKPGQDGNPDLGLSYLMEEVRELWVPADPTARECPTRSTVTGDYQWVDGNDEQADAAGIPRLEPESSQSTIPCGDFDGGGWQQPSTEFLAGLPRDADALYDRLLSDTEGRGEEDVEVLVYVADLLRSGQVPADLRAALYRTLAKVPGLEITEELANLDGHTGTAFGISRGGERHDVIIDQRTGDFIGERQIDEEGVAGVPAGSVLSYTSVANPVIVDEVGATG